MVQSFLLDPHDTSIVTQRYDVVVDSNKSSSSNRKRVVLYPTIRYIQQLLSISTLHPLFYHIVQDPSVDVLTNSQRASCGFRPSDCVDTWETKVHSSCMCVQFHDFHSRIGFKQRCVESCGPVSQCSSLLCALLKP